MTLLVLQQNQDIIIIQSILKSAKAINKYQNKSKKKQKMIIKYMNVYVVLVWTYNFFYIFFNFI